MHLFVMIIYVARIYLLLVIVHPINIIGQEFSVCPTGWFGPNCKFMCFCAVTDACGSLGGCELDSCKPGYFGVGCQYVDLLAKYATYEVPLYLRDDNTRTCNQDEGATSIEITLTYTTAFSWYRLIIKDIPGVDLSFNTTFNAGEPCTNQRYYKLRKSEMDITLDVTCGMRVIMRSLRIDGNIAGYICSLYISGGRNVALKEMTHQSSNYLNDPIMYGSSNAVDGNTDGVLEQGSCTTTGIGDRGAEWWLAFSKPVRVSSISIYNSNEYKYRLSSFIISMYDGDYDLEYNYTNSQILDVYNIQVALVTNVSFLRIKQHAYEENMNSILTICEVKVFGDTICPDNTFGLTCEYPCYCEVNNACNSITGVCARMCHPDIDGANCSSRCTENCMYSTCKHLSGDCIHCKAGYMGEYCNEVCPAGTFGNKCELKCSTGCSDVCDYVNGTCNCRHGYDGQMCLVCGPDNFGLDCKLTCPSGCAGDCNRTDRRCFACVQGWYDEYCDKSCSEFCLGKLCNMSDGECFSCFGNRIGEICQECEYTFYGLRCESQCSENCHNRTCDHVSGRCPKCKKGFKGEMCLGVVEKPSVWMAPLSFIPFLFLLFLCIPGGSSDSDDDTDTSDVDTSTGINK